MATSPQTKFTAACMTFAGGILHFLYPDCNTDREAFQDELDTLDELQTRFGWRFGHDLDRECLHWMAAVLMTLKYSESDWERNLAILVDGAAWPRSDNALADWASYHMCDLHAHGFTNFSEEGWREAIACVYVSMLREVLDRFAT